MNINAMTFVAPNLAWGEARGGSIPASAAVTDEQRSRRPNSAHPAGRQLRSAQRGSRATGGQRGQAVPGIVRVAQGLAAVLAAATIPDCTRRFGPTVPSLSHASTWGKSLIAW